MKQVLDTKPDSEGVYTLSPDGGLNPEQVAYLHELAEAVFLLPSQRRAFELRYLKLAHERGALPAILHAMKHIEALLKHKEIS